MTVNFYTATSGSAKLVISMTLIDGKIKTKASPSYKNFAKEILNKPATPLDGSLDDMPPVTAVNNPQLFLTAMPHSYMGSYFWAEVAK